MSPATRNLTLPSDLRLACAEAGDPAGIPPLLLHGLSDSWRSFARVLPHLPQGIRAIAVSLRGHGDSDRPGRGCGSADFASDLAGLTRCPADLAAFATEAASRRDAA